MSNDLHGMRAQIQANARLMICPVGNPRPVTHPTLPSLESGSTLVPAPNANSGKSAAGDVEVVVFGNDGNFTGAVMVGVKPAIEAASAGTPEGALRKLLLATTELLNMYMPKLGSHQRAIHGGGVFDEDLISPALAEAQKKVS